MTPERHDLYKCSLKVSNADTARVPGSVILDQPSNGASQYCLKVCYRKYTGIKNGEHAKLAFVNLVFLHGNGMNKGIWHYHITKLYEKFNLGRSRPVIDTVIAVDSVNHGHSAEINKGKLGNVYNWNDGAKDVIKLLKEDEYECFERPNTMNIIIGHSMGGNQATRVSYIEPNLIDSTILINPVFVLGPEYVESLKIALEIAMKKGIMVNTLTIPRGQDWRKYTFEFYRTRSFWKKFNEKVLNYMFEDDISDNLKNSAPDKVDKVAFNTSAFQQLAAYLNSYKSTCYSLPTFPVIEVPIYYINSSSDYEDEDNLVFLRGKLKNVKPINLDVGTHLVHAEEPDLILDTILNIIEERVRFFNSNGDKRYLEQKLLKEDGENYKSKVWHSYLMTNFSKAFKL